MGKEDRATVERFRKTLSKTLFDLAPRLDPAPNPIFVSLCLCVRFKLLV